MKARRYIMNILYQIRITPQYYILKTYENLKIIFMIQNITRQLFNFLRPHSVAFSTYRIKGDTPFRSVTKDVKQNQKYSIQDAEKAYEDFLEQNPSSSIEAQTSSKKLRPQADESFCFDPYQILGLHTGATKDQIKSAYRQLAMKYNPKNNSSPEDANKFIKISKAYEMLNPTIKKDKKSTINSSQYMAELNNLVKDYVGIEPMSKKSKESKVNTQKRQFSESEKTGKQDKQSIFTRIDSSKDK